MPFQAWIFATLLGVGSAGGMLQWGHALSGMDIGTWGFWLVDGQGLQWGHALSGMDIISPGYKAYYALLLQWGHALSGMDMPDRIHR